MGTVLIWYSRIKIVFRNHLGAVGLKSNGPQIFFFCWLHMMEPTMCSQCWSLNLHLRVGLEQHPIYIKEFDKYIHVCVCVCLFIKFFYFKKIIRVTDMRKTEFQTWTNFWLFEDLFFFNCYFSFFLLYI